MELKKLQRGDNMRVLLTEKENEIIELIKPYTILDNKLTPKLSKNSPENVKRAYNEFLEMKKHESKNRPRY
ncbi:MAG: hypothetical protein PUG48_11130 [Clostridia bacterium]|nr:hypothetical protein [Clostridia bacterium]